MFHLESWTVPFLLTKTGNLKGCADTNKTQETRHLAEDTRHLTQDTRQLAQDTRHKTLITRLNILIYLSSKGALQENKVKLSERVY